MPYWRQVLQHGLDGNLQAVMDEQVHVLVEAEGLSEQPASERVAGVATALVEALSLRTAQLHVDELRPRPRARRIDIEPVGMRCRFALRFAEIRDDKATAVVRADTVRKAFNSPFRPSFSRPLRSARRGSTSMFGATPSCIGTCHPTGRSRAARGACAPLQGPCGTQERRPAFRARRTQGRWAGTGIPGWRCSSWLPRTGRQIPVTWSPIGCTRCPTGVGRAAHSVATV